MIAAGLPAQAEHTAPRDEERDRRTVRRGMRAGLLVWVVFGLVMGVGLSPGGTRGVVAGVLLALVGGALVASGWLLVSMGLDVHAGHWPSRRRLWWTTAVTIFALVSPVLVVAAGG